RGPVRRDRATRPRRRTGEADMAAESHTVGTWPRPLLDETIGDNFARAVSLFGDRDALVERQSGRRWTYRELADEVDELARGLLEAGISPGDRVGIWAPNCGEWVIVQYACAVIGAIMVNLNPAYGTHEIEYVLNLAGVRPVIAAPRYKTSDYAAMLDEVRPRCPGLERAVLLGGPCWASLRQRGLPPP